MRLHLRPPSVEALRSLADAQRDLELTYEPVGVTAHDDLPSGYLRDCWSRSIGAGDDVFDAAVASVRSWGLQRGSGLIVAADGDVEVGVIVAMSAPLPVGWVDVVCRVVDVTDRPDEWSFTYGTLPEHPEQGEERFTVRRDAAGDVQVIIDAVSLVRNPLARLAPPIARALQTRAVERYLDAAETAVAVAR